MKKIIAVIIALILFAGCGSKAAQNGEAPSASAVNVGKGDIFTYDDLHAFLVSKPVKCAWKDGTSIIEDKLDISEISDLTYTVQDRTTNDMYKTAAVSGSFVASGALDSHTAANKITSEPVQFQITVNKDVNGFAFSDYTTSNAPIIKPIEPIDLDNLLQYIDIEKEGPIVPYSKPNPAYNPDDPLAILEPEYILGAGRFDLNNPDLRIVVINGRPQQDEMDMTPRYDVEFYDGEDYICTSEIGISLFDYPRATIGDTIKLR